MKKILKVLFVFATISSGAWAANPYADFIHSDKGVADGSFIAPNELKTEIYAPLVSGKTGALVSVGTFRTLTTASYGDYQVVYMFDYDSKVYEFNWMNLELIKMSADRTEYLAYLFVKDPKSKMVKDYRAKKIGDEKLWQWLLLETELNTKGPYAAELQALYQEKGSLSYNNWFLLHNYIVDGWVRQMKDHFQGNFLGNDEMFFKIKQMAQEGRIIPVVGDLAGQFAAKSICETLTKQGVPLDTLDISNSWDYFEYAEQYERMFNNFSRCPGAQSSSVFFTIPSFFYGDHSEYTYSESYNKVNFTQSVFALFQDSTTLNAWMYLNKKFSELVKFYKAEKKNVPKWEKPNQFVQDLALDSTSKGELLNEEWLKVVSERRAEEHMRPFLKKDGSTRASTFQTRREK